jgi:hypothetical protein
VLVIRVLAVVVVVAACGGSDAPPPRDPRDTPPSSGLGMRRPPETVQSFGLLAGAPGAAETTDAPPPAEPAHLAEPAWAGARIAQGAAPPVFAQVWRRAPNRDTCALLVPSTLGEGEGGRPRAERTPGGWGVAYDRPGGPGAARDGTTCPTCGRGAFGIAGTRVEVAGALPLHREWSDGSRADYGREGGDDSSTPRPYVAHLRVDGQECLYSLWSHLGRDHLEHLLEHLQLVERETAP